MSVNPVSKVFAAACIFVLMQFSANAQNVVMANGIKAPSAVKVDGKLIEWGTLPAYNRNTTLHYTLANDAKNLYLAITSTDQPNINKLLNGGLTFTVNKEGKKRDKDAVTITYPLGRGGMRGFRGGNRGANVDTAAIVAEHKQTIAGAKELSVIGIEAITDTLVSIYNTFGIKIGVSFDTKGNLFYELAIPLQLLQLNADKTTEIAYNIKLNGVQFGGGGNRGNGRQGGDGGGRNGGNGNGFGIGGGGGFGGAMGDMMIPTDFWGKYKLATP